MCPTSAEADVYRLRGMEVMEGERKETGVEQGLDSSTWWDEAEYRQLGTVNDRALFILDKLLKRDIPKFQAAWAVDAVWSLVTRAEHGQR